MILVDYSQTAIAAVYAEAKGEFASAVMSEDMIRHIILNTLRNYKVMFGAEYGKLIVCTDSRNYWRYDLHPNYKGTRKKKKEDSTLDWKEVHRIMDKVRSEIDLHLPFPVIHVDRCEADDIIAVLTKMSQDDVDDSSLFGEPKPTLIISSDTDYVQLQRYPNVKQYSPMFKQMVKAKVSPIYDLNYKLVVGDSGDCIPGIKSDLNCLFEGIRQTPTKETEKVAWSTNIACVPDKYQSRLEQNRDLIDMTRIPVQYEKAILREYQSKANEVKKNGPLWQYFATNGLNELLSNINDFN